MIVPFHSLVVTSLVPFADRGAADAGKWKEMVITVVGSVAMVFMNNAEDQRLNQGFGEKGEKIDNANMIIGSFFSGFFGFFLPSPP